MGLLRRGRGRSENDFFSCHFWSATTDSATHDPIRLLPSTDIQASAGRSIQIPRGCSMSVHRRRYLEVMMEGCTNLWWDQWESFLSLLQLSNKTFCRHVTTATPTAQFSSQRKVRPPCVLPFLTILAWASSKKLSPITLLQKFRRCLWGFTKVWGRRKRMGLVASGRNHNIPSNTRWVNIQKYDKWRGRTKLSCILLQKFRGDSVPRWVALLCR